MSQADLIEADIPLVLHNLTYTTRYDVVFFCKIHSLLYFIFQCSAAVKYWKAFVAILWCLKVPACIFIIIYYPLNEDKTVRFSLNIFRNSVMFFGIQRHANPHLVVYQRSSFISSASDACHRNMQNIAYSIESA